MADEKPPVDTSIEQLQSLVTQAEQGNSGVLPAIREMLTGQSQLWQHCTDLAEVLISSAIKQISLGDARVAESLTLKIELMKAELGGTSPTGLERVVVERIIVCWLQIRQCDRLTSLALPKQMMRMLSRRQKHARRQMLTTIQTLATVKRLEPASLRSLAEAR